MILAGNETPVGVPVLPQQVERVPTGGTFLLRFGHPSGQHIPEPGQRGGLVIRRFHLLALLRRGVPAGHTIAAIALGNADSVVRRLDRVRQKTLLPVDRRQTCLEMPVPAERFHVDVRSLHDQFGSGHYGILRLGSVR